MPLVIGGPSAGLTLGLQKRLPPGSKRPPVSFGVGAKLKLEDNVSFILMEDGVSRILLEPE